MTNNAAQNTLQKPRVAIIGKGALGLLYADAIAASCGTDVVAFVMDEARLARHAGESYSVNGKPVDFRNATPRDLGPVDLVMIAVKSGGLQGALDLVESLLGERTVIVSVLNGITSESKVAARYGWDRVVPCVAQGMDAVHKGSSLVYTQPGQLHIGRFEQTPQEAFDRVRGLFEVTGIPFVVEDDIRYRMWAKLLTNVGINQTCAVYDQPYGEVLDREGESFRTFVAAMREVIAVGNAEGVPLTEKDLNFAIALENSLDPKATPSMGQDRQAHRKSEVDEFSGEIMRRAARHGIQVPTNAWLNRRMREIEETY